MIVEVREAKDLLFLKMDKHSKADYVVAQGLVVVERLNASEASLADRKGLLGIVGVIPEAG